MLENEPLEKYHEREIMERLRRVAALVPAALDAIATDMAGLETDYAAVDSATTAQLKAIVKRNMIKERDALNRQRRMIATLSDLILEELREFTALPPDNGI